MAQSVTKHKGRQARSDNGHYACCRHQNNATLWGPLGEVDPGWVGREVGKNADICATGALRFLVVGAVVLDTGLPEVTDLFVVGLLIIPVSNACTN